MKSSRGIGLLNTILLILFLAIIFYLFGFFLSFQIGDFDGVSLAFLCVFLVLTSFSFGMFIFSLSSAFFKNNVLQSMSFIAILLSVLTLVTSAGTAVFKLVSLISIPALIFHLFILGVFIANFLNQRISVSPKGTKDPGEQRKALRMKDYATAQYSSDGNTWKNAGVYDISASGIRLIIQEEIDAGRDIELKMYIPQDVRPIFATGRIVWKTEFFLEKKTFHVGAKFIKIDSSDILRLSLKQVYSLFREHVT
ncbi:MAG: PilZ domain-containing protein [Candidatus Omnitrophica bacterium]|nr:PilZ domain-containing protein [Candidatus Omnitrophota bacterium]